VPEFQLVSEETSCSVSLWALRKILFGNLDKEVKDADAEGDEDEDTKGSADI
jgi:hypothetical protein